jgi:7-cyano-7-deazaguanine synthase
MKKAISLVSGGMDSLVTLAVALQKYKTYPLHVNYGQRTENKELECFRKITGFYGLSNRLEVGIDYLAKIGGSALLDKSARLEEGKPKGKVIPSSYVPFRNTHLLSIAVSWAEVIGAEKIFIGVVAPDGSGYPDCTPSYIAQFNRLLKLGAKNGKRIKVIAPLIRLTKAQIIRKGSRLGVPFQYTWSCYRSNKKACGKCQSCYLRLKGFRTACVKDPIRYR